MLEMGRNDLTSAGSRSGFFNRGVMYAALNPDGTTPSDSERLNSAVRNSESTSTWSFMQQACRYRVGRRLPVRQLTDNRDNIVSGQLSEVVQRAIRRCSRVLWRRCSIRRRTHTGNFVVHEPMKIVSSDGPAGRGGSTTHEVINRNVININKNAATST